MSEPLMTPAIFQILLSLADGDRHGYGIMREVDERTGGDFELGPGTLYRSIGRMIDDGLIEEVHDPVEDGRQRRPYGLTSLGREVLAREAAELSRMVEQAASKGVPLTDTRS